MLEGLNRRIEEIQVDDKLIATNDRITLLWVVVLALTLSFVICLGLMLGRQDRIERRVDAIQDVLTRK